MAISISFRWFYYIDKYSTNLLLTDNWDFYKAHFQSYPLWDFFTYQHGPHRQGIGFILTKWLDDWSGWNTRVIAFAIGALIFLAALIYWQVKRKIKPGFTGFEALIFLILLIPRQQGLFTGTTNISHGAMPVLLLALISLCFFLKNLYLRNALLIFLNFNMIFSAFGLFTGFILPIVFIGELFFFLRAKDSLKALTSALSIVLSLAPWLLFFHNYEFVPAAPDFVFPHPRPWEYVQYVVLAFAGVLGVTHTNLIGVLPGLVIVSILVYILIFHVRSLCKTCFEVGSKTTSISKVIVTLISFSFLFICFTAVGRISFGVGSAINSRYVSYLMPAILAIYFHAISKAKKEVLWNSWMLFVMLISTTFVGSSINQMKRIHGEKSRWKEAYLKYESIEKADSLSNFSVHPDSEGTDLKQKLNYLREHRLNLYLDQ